MKIKSQILPNVVNFPNTQKERIKIEEFISELTRNLTTTNELPEWEIRFVSFLGECDFFGVSKKGYTYTSPPEKTYTIYIYIPTIDKISWGVEKSDFVNSPPVPEDKYEKLELGFDYSHFDNMNDYIVECSKKGIEYYLTKGISLKRVKLKI